MMEEVDISGMTTEQIATNRVEANAILDAVGAKRIRKYRSRPVEVEAVYFLAYTKGPEIIAWLEERGCTGTMCGSWFELSDPGPAYIEAIVDGFNFRIDVGDWVVCGRGGFRALSASEFARVYEPIESSAPKEEKVEE